MTKSRIGLCVKVLAMPLIKKNKNITAQRETCVTLLAASLGVASSKRTSHPPTNQPLSQPASLPLFHPLSLTHSLHNTFCRHPAMRQGLRVDRQPRPSLSLPTSHPPAIFSLSTSPIRILVAVGNDEATRVMGSVSGAVQNESCCLHT